MIKGTRGYRIFFSRLINLFKLLQDTENNKQHFDIHYLSYAKQLEIERGYEE